MSFRGDIRLGETIDVKFTTRRFSTGAPFTLAGSPVVSAYVDNGTTEITAGITLTVDFDSRTGLNNVRVVATSGNGYATGTNVDLVITTGTVDSVSVVGEVVASFSIEKRSALMPTTAGRTLDVSSGGEAGVDWANVGSPTTTNNLSGTTVGTVSALASGSITAAVIATGAIDADALAADTITAAKVAPDVHQEQIELSFTYDATADYATAHAGSLVKQIADNAGGSALTTDAIAEALFTYDATATYGTANAGSVVKQIADNAGGSALTEAGIADAVWDEARAGHVAAGSFGQGVASVQGNVTGSVASVTGAVGSVTGSVGSVATGGITAATFAAGAIDAAAMNVTGSEFTAIPWNAAWDAEVQSEAADALTAYGAATATQVDAGSLLLFAGTVTNGHDQAIALGSLGFGNDELNDLLIRVRDASSGEIHSRWIDDFFAAGSIAALDSALPFTTESGVDTFAVFAIRRNVSANVVQISGDTTAADNAEAFFDGSGYNGANNILGVVNVVETCNDLGAGSIEFSTFAVDAINAGVISADAVAEIQSGLSTLTAAGVRTAVGLASANLDTQLAAIDDFLDTEIAAIKAVTDQLTAAQAEPAAVPAANATPLAKIAWIATLARNRRTQTSTTQTIFADDGSTPVATSVHSDDGTTHIRGEWQ